MRISEDSFSFIAVLKFTSRVRNKEAFIFSYADAHTLLHMTNSNEIGVVRAMLMSKGSLGRCVCLHTHSKAHTNLLRRFFK